MQLNDGCKDCALWPSVTTDGIKTKPGLHVVNVNACMANYKTQASTVEGLVNVAIHKGEFPCSQHPLRNEFWEVWIRLKRR